MIDGTIIEINSKVILSFRLQKRNTINETECRNKSPFSFKWYLHLQNGSSSKKHVVGHFFSILQMVSLTLFVICI